ncbi:MAG TPA: D-alanyl-D-alanine carboxypeptidase family protein [Actinomycetota bacterium]|nr:D-alanyl-D-alanine carboxypeptidase family protein [Actinomycetota bacterium]
MTLLCSGLGLGLALLLTLFGIRVGDAATNATRAQTAADAAALAAVAESTLFGDGEPERAAARMAELNGAELVSCLCEAGATAAQIEVEVEGVQRAARAVFDPDALAPAAPTSSGELHPLLRAAVDRLIQASGGSIRIVSGYRTHAEQARLWSEAVDRYGDPEIADDWVARPGTSAHERGLAVDLGGDIELAVRLVHTLGLPLLRPLQHEPWHFELSP